MVFFSDDKVVTMLYIIFLFVAAPKIVTTKSSLTIATQKKKKQQQQQLHFQIFFPAEIISSFTELSSDHTNLSTTKKPITKSFTQVNFRITLS